MPSCISIQQGADLLPWITWLKPSDSTRLPIKVLASGFLLLTLPILS